MSVSCSEMAPSPFHGIFNAFSNGQAEHAAPGLSLEEHQDVRSDAPSHVQSGQTGQAGQIAVDIYEMDNYYIIRAPIAGVRLSDIDIEVDEKVLTIKGRRSPSDTVPANQYYLQECFWGDFSRSITLPVVIDPKKVRATYSKDSILKVIIPKEEKVKIVRISEG